VQIVEFVVHSSLAIANEFIARAKREGRSLTHMHIQKLVYLAHGWNLAVNGKSLIEDDIEAWDFGPVVRKLYDALKQNTNRPVRQKIRWGDDTPFRSDDGEVAEADLSPKEEAVIEKVWSTYKNFEAFQLSALTHEHGSPWDEFYERGKNRVIDNNKIWDYFADVADRDD
jgi:uncharacterized phage-associated protein